MRKFCKFYVIIFLSFFFNSCYGNVLKNKITLELIVQDLIAPIFILSSPDNTERKFIGEQTGTIKILNSNGVLLKKPFLDLRPLMTPLLKAFDERGLLSLAFHPKFIKNGLIYINYSSNRRKNSPFNGPTAYTWKTSEFKVSNENPNRVDILSERVLLQFDWINRKHNGGGLAFGPDGFLYIGVGDGGGVHGDSNKIYDAFKVPKEFHKFDKYAQNTNLLKGKILRIDVNKRDPVYGIPKSNFFAGNELGRKEIYAWGFRNPFRLSFDKKNNGDIYVNGVAETFWETIYLVNKQGNYGWAIREGTHCFSRANPFNPPTNCPKKGILGQSINFPIIQYPNWSVNRKESNIKEKSIGTASIGGFIYRGNSIPELYGKLVFGDYSKSIKKPSGQIFYASPSSDKKKLWEFSKLLEVNGRIHSLGEDLNNELYVLTTDLGIPVGNTGKVWKIVSN